MNICKECGGVGGEHKIYCAQMARAREEAQRVIVSPGGTMSWSDGTDWDRRRDALPKWEYRVVASWADRTDIEQVNEKLNEIGAEGWELVATLGYWYHFKRQLVL